MFAVAHCCRDVREEEAIRNGYELFKDDDDFVFGIGVFKAPISLEKPKVLNNED